MLRPSNRLFSLASIVALTGLLACSSSSTGGGTGTGDGGGGGGGDGGDASIGDGGGGDGGGKVDSGTDAVNSCKMFLDLTAASAVRTLTWDFSIVTAPERCVTIKKGQDVTFKGDFAVHPLTASGGDTPNPISGVDATGKVTFTAAGTFGFQCGIHPSMTGAIEVIE